MAAKISKNESFDVDNANVEIKFLQTLKNSKRSCKDYEGKDRIV